jgi:hypothetical protein
MTTRAAELEAMRLVHTEVRSHALVAERAGRDGEVAAASIAYVEAGRAAVAGELWRVAVRCYRSALEIDLTDRAVVARLRSLGARAGEDWTAYMRTLERTDWSRFGCRGATIVGGGDRTIVQCPKIGPVLDIAMRDLEHVEARPVASLARMPLAMALIILRRALWPDARALWPEPSRGPAMKVRVAFGTERAVWLDELGDWRPT